MAVKIIGKINLPKSNWETALEKAHEELTNENVLIIRNMRTEEQLENSNSLEEYEKIMEEHQMLHWLQLGINKEATDKYFADIVVIERFTLNFTEGVVHEEGQRSYPMIVSESVTRQMYINFYQDVVDNPSKYTRR